jgi:protein-L-isoaspartate(D-aspartate) O-methyltransferase
LFCRTGQKKSLPIQHSRAREAGGGDFTITVALRLAGGLKNLNLTRLFLGGISRIPELSMHADIAREQMINQQVRAWDVLDERVLELMNRIPRERFVPAQYRDVAFADTEIPLAHGRRMLAPKVVGRILQAVDAQPTDGALEIGTGSGYLTACLAATCRSVRSLEIHEDIATAARSNLAGAGVMNADVITADGTQLGDAPRYEVIVLTASLPVPDERYQRALQVGGRMFVVIGEAPVMEARLIRRTSESTWTSESLFETFLEPMIHAERPSRFRF